jgi:hypothetical protein
MRPNTPSDVKSHLSNHTRSHIHLMPPATMTDSPPVSGEESGKTNTGNLAVGTLEQPPAIELQPHATTADSNSGSEVSSELSHSVQR